MPSRSYVRRATAKRITPTFAPYKAFRRGIAATAKRLAARTVPHKPIKPTDPLGVRAKPGTTASRALAKRIDDCYKRQQRKQVIHALGKAGGSTRRQYKKWGKPCH